MQSAVISAAMNNSEKFCLKWEEFQKNLLGSFADLREDEDLTDVTLACDDQQVEAHKLVLSASSPFFQKIFKKNKNPHHLIYLRGLKAQELISIVEFIYYGEVSIYQEDLNIFIDIATELKLKGLTGSNSEEPTGYIRQEKVIMEKSSVIDRKPTYISKTLEEYPNQAAIEDIKPYIKPDYLNIPMEEYHNQTAIVNIKPNQKYVKDSDDVAEQIKSMMNKIDGLWTCAVCGVGKKHPGHMREHIETHLEGLSYPCEKCGKSYRSSQSFRMHTLKHCTF